MSWAVAAAWGSTQFARLPMPFPPRWWSMFTLVRRGRRSASSLPRRWGSPQSSSRALRGVKGRCLRLVRTVPGKGKNFRYWGRPVLL